jgi:Leucine-rich repeat (LRR) protein
MDGLQRLDLFRANYNNLDSIPQELLYLQRLEVLDLSRNTIRYLPSDWRRMQGLRFLYLGYNSIDEIPPSIGYCQRLQELDVVHAGILRLPPQLANIQRLDYVYIDQRTQPFYQNPRFERRQRIIVTQQSEGGMYRPGQP